MTQVIFDPSHVENNIVDGDYIKRFNDILTQEDINKGYEAIELEEEITGIITYNHYHIVDYPDDPKLIKKTAGERAALDKAGEDLVTKQTLNANRTGELYGGFVFDGHPFDSDPYSLQNINGAVTRALIAQAEGDNSYVEQWITADNEVITLNINEIIAFGKAAVTHVSNIYKKYKALKDAV